MSKIVDYMVICRTTPCVNPNFEQTIRKMILNGWQPLGGLSSTLIEDGNIFFVQAMVKYEEEIRYHIDKSVPYEYEIPEDAKIEPIRDEPALAEVLPPIQGYGSM